MAKNIIEQFVETLTPKDQKQNHNYSAEVSRIDNEGVVWVYLAGSDKETPTALSSAEVKKGDVVNVEWRNNKLYIAGNNTNPSAGIARVVNVEQEANRAKNAAEIAKVSAQQAVADAQRAKESAESAETSASNAEISASNAETSASNAESSASSASSSASAAGENASRAQAAAEAAQLAVLSTITSDTLHYLATPLDSGVTRQTSGWTTTVQTMTSTNKYLWTYHTYTSANGNTSDTEPIITGVYGSDGHSGVDGSTIWTTTTAPTSPNYTFTISKLNGPSEMSPKVGDIIIYSYYRYTITSVASTTVLAGSRVSIRGATGASSKWYSGTTITGTSTEAKIFPNSGISSAVAGDMYLNTDTGYTYRCSTAGAASVAKWVYTTDITGPQGEQGETGDTGVSITSVQPQYYLSTESSSATGGSWSNSMTYAVGKYIWTRDQITYSNNTTGYSTAVYNSALTQSCKDAADAMGIVQEQQEYFWHDSLGAHILSDKSTVSGTRYRTDIKGSGLEINEINQTEKSVAKFGASGARIGMEDETHLEMDYHSLQLKDSNGKPYFLVNDLRTQHSDGYYYELSEKWIADYSTFWNFQNLSFEAINTDYKVYVNNSEYTDVTKETELFIFTTLPPNGSVVRADYKTADTNLKTYTVGIRKDNSAEGYMSYAEGCNVTASGELSHVEGKDTTASGKGSHAEGWDTTASGEDSHAEGCQTNATSKASHSEGLDTTASGENSHAEGAHTTASGYQSHAEGYNTTASGDSSHASGQYTKASRRSQTVIGEYNVEDNTGTSSSLRGQYAFILGNGTSSNRSNAFTIDWDGNVDIPAGAAFRVNGSPIADFVVEQGTSGIWTYRKWNSGVMECWYSNSFTVNFDTQAVANLRTSTTTNSVTMPSTLTSVTEYNVSGYNTGSTGWATLVTGAISGSNIILSYMGWSSSGNHTVIANIYIKGRWK